MALIDEFNLAAQRLYELCEYPAVQYHILYRLLQEPYESKRLTALREAFLTSDIVEELNYEQDSNGGFGNLFEKDYSVKAKFPTSLVAINRCLYIGLTLNDRDILLCAKEYLEDFLNGKASEKLKNKNERDVPNQHVIICDALEAIQGNNQLCNRTINEWTYICERTFADGEYSYDRERSAQQEIFLTKESRLIPMPISLLLKRENQISEQVEYAMLQHYGEHVFYHGHFWDNCPAKLPETFCYEKTRRWMYSFRYINQFHNSRIFLKEIIDWIMENQNQDGVWNWGPQIKDPWGYFNYFSTNRQYKHNQMVDCTLEILNLLRVYIDHNEL